MRKHLTKQGVNNDQRPERLFYDEKGTAANRLDEGMLPNKIGKDQLGN